MATPHISANVGDFAKTVIMPGDPLRAKFIAETYLTDVTLVNGVRNMFGYTGYYNGKKVSVMGSGMGMPSIGIYSYELYNVYGVENIIRVGSAGSYVKEANVYDVVLATSAYSESSFAKTAFGYEENIQTGSKMLEEKLKQSAEKLNIPMIEGRIHSADVFYRNNGDVYKDVVNKYDCKVVEMESFALFANARYLNKNAACILTVSDSFVTHEVTTSEERQKSFHNMIKIALDTAASL